MRFFGGLGIYFGAVQFAMIMGNTLYFVVDDASREKYEKAGMRSISYLTKKGRVPVRKHFELPQKVLIDVPQLRRWVSESIQADGKAAHA